MTEREFDRLTKLTEAMAAIEREDFMRATDLLRPLAEMGDTEAQFRFGTIDHHGGELPPDEVHFWLEKAALQNHPEACYRFACFLGASNFQPDSAVEKFIPRLHHAAELGYAPAQYHLASCYSTGEWPSGSGPHNLALAARWYFAAAVQGHADSQFEIAWLFLKGAGFEQNIDNAMHWLRLAAAQGHEEAIKHLAELEEDAGLNSATSG